MNLSMQELGKTIDNHQMVNSSLVDNEFGSAELPCRLNTARLLKSISALVTRGTKFRLSDHLECVMPLECSVKWLVVFLARFGSEWLREKSGVRNLERWAHLPLDEQKKVFRHRVGAIAVFRTTFEEGGDHISPLCPASPLVETPLMEQDLRLAVSERAGLPYMCSGYAGDKDICFGEFSSSVQEVLHGWDRRALSVLASDERKSVEAMSSCDITCFAKMMSSRLPTASLAQPDLGGVPTYSISEHIGGSYFEERKNFCSFIPTSTPVFRRNLWPGRFENKLVDQACVHIDNWAALESGRRLNAITSADEISDTSQQRGKQALLRQKTIEIRAYEYDLSRDVSVGTRAAWGIVFRGCVMESVRAFLAHSVVSLSAVDMLRMNRRPRMERAMFGFQCSTQLRNCLRESQNGVTEIGMGSVRAWNIETRLLWELQLHFHNAVSNQAVQIEGSLGLMESSELMVLCILGFPSLEVTKGGRAAEDKFRSDREEAIHDNATVFNIYGNGENSDCDTQRVLYHVKPVQGPQQMSLTVSVDCGTGAGELEVVVGENRMTPNMFEWQAWKDSFMGRVKGQTEWRKHMVSPDGLQPREEALESMLSTPVMNLDDGVKQWAGWPPLHPQMSMISAEGIFDPHRHDFVRVQKAMRYAARKTKRASEADDVVISAAEETAERLRAAAHSAKEERRLTKSVKILCKCIRVHNDTTAMDELLKVLRENGDDFVIKVKSEITRSVDYVVRSTLESRRQQNEGLEGAESATIPLEKLCIYVSSLQEMCPSRWFLSRFQLRCLFELRNPKILPTLQKQQEETKFLAKGPLLAAIFCFDQWKSSGEPYMRLMGESHLEAYAPHPPFTNIALSIGYLFEKGIFRGRQSVRLHALRRRIDGPDLLLEETACHFVAHSPHSLHAVRKNTATPVQIYERFIEVREPEPRVLNRLGLVYLLDNDGLQDLERSEMLLNLAKIRRSKDAMCNLAVLYGMYRGKWDLAEQNLTRAALGRGPATRRHSHRFERPATNNVSINGNWYNIWPSSDICRNPHTSSMSNLAVTYEMEGKSFGDVGMALVMYERILEIDDNPAARLNMAALLKLGLPAARDEIRSNELLRTLKSRLPDIPHMPMLTKGTEQLGECTSDGARWTWSLAVDELDDCAVFVKIFHQQS